MREGGRDVGTCVACRVDKAVVADAERRNYSPTSAAFSPLPRILHDCSL